MDSTDKWSTAIVALVIVGIVVLGIVSTRADSAANKRFNDEARTGKIVRVDEDGNTVCYRKAGVEHCRSQNNTSVVPMPIYIGR